MYKLKLPEIVSNTVVWIVILLTHDVSCAQETLMVRVLDKKSKGPVEYAYVASGDGFKTYTDSLGNCRIGYVDVKDILSVKCLGYLNYSAPVSEIIKSGRIYLEPKETTLHEVVIKPGSTEIITAPYIRKTHTRLHGAMLPYNLEVCTFAPLPVEGKKHIVTIRVMLGKGEVENPIRLHVYSADEQGVPKEDLLDSNVIIYNKDISKSEYTLSVGDKDINITDSKIFIGIEWPGLYKLNYELKFKIGPKILQSESIAENRSFYRSEKTEGWAPLFYFDKHPTNMLVSVDYTIE